MTVTSIQTAVGYSVFAILLLFALWLIRNQAALRDIGTGDNRPFSFSRVQLLFWTVIILGCWLLIYALRQELWKFNAECLALLGISVGTTAAARVIDDRDQAGARSNAGETSAGFLHDILSDASGPSVHRFQCLMFNLAFGATFVVRVFTESKGEFPSFDATTLALLAASSGGYLVIKSGEAATATATAPAKAPQEAPARQKPTTRSDELVDPDDALLDH